MCRTSTRFRGTLRLCCLASAIFASRPALAQEVGPEARSRASFWQAAAGVVATNWVTWGYNRYVQRWPWSKVGWSTWGKNLEQGFTWDDNSFVDNQLAHPYHGSFYHGSARASGFDFWQSIPFVFAGSASWELFGETIQPSLNDLITTTFGGLALGEVTYRLSSMLRGSEGRGGGGIIGGLGSFAFNPMARSQMLLRQTWDPAEPGGSQLSGQTRLAVGRYRDRTFGQLNLHSRSVFDPAARRPYDAFELELQLGPPPGMFHRLGISGVLARHPLIAGRRDHLVLALYQHYDYEDRIVFRSGAQSVSGALWYRHGLGGRTQLDIGLHAEGIVLGGITSDYGNYFRRDYDLGPGAGARVGTRLTRDGREWLRVDSKLTWLHSVHGSNGNHLVSDTRVTVMLPLWSSLAVGGNFASTDRYSTYPGFSPVHRRTSELRGFLAWAPS